MFLSWRNVAAPLTLVAKFLALEDDQRQTSGTVMVLELAEDLTITVTAGTKIVAPVPNLALIAQLPRVAAGQTITLTYEGHRPAAPPRSSFAQRFLFHIERATETEATDETEAAP